MDCTCPVAAKHVCSIDKSILQQPESKVAPLTEPHTHVKVSTGHKEGPQVSKLTEVVASRRVGSCCGYTINLVPCCLPCYRPGTCRLSHSRLNFIGHQAELQWSSVPYLVNVQRISSFIMPVQLWHLVKMAAASSGAPFCIKMYHPTGKYDTFQNIRANHTLRCNQRFTQGRLDQQLINDSRSKPVSLSGLHQQAVDGLEGHTIKPHTYKWWVVGGNRTKSKVSKLKIACTTCSKWLALPLHQTCLTLA